MVSDRVTRGGESAIPPALWLIIDYLFPFLLFATELAFLASAVAAWGAWRTVCRTDTRRSTGVRTLFIGGAIASTLGTIVLAALTMPNALALVGRSLLCVTTTFSEATSPNGRYAAAVAEVNCGAVTGSNRQVFLIRRPFWWAPSSILYVRQHPALESFMEWTHVDNARNEDDYTALHHAVSQGHFLAASRLLELGADPTALDHFGNVPKQVQTQLPQVKAGDFVEANAFTNSDDLTQTLEEYNKRAPPGCRIDVVAIVHLRDASGTAEHLDSAQYSTYG